MALLPASHVAGPDPLNLALRAIKMSPHDLSFKKDVTDSEQISGKARLFLQQPLQLPSYARSTLAGLQTSASLESLAAFASGQLELPACTNLPAQKPVALDPGFLASLPPPLARAVQKIASAAAAAQPALPTPNEAAFAAFSVESLNNAELDSLSDASRDLARRADALELQDDELANALLSAGDRLDRAALLRAFMELAGAVDAAIAELSTNSFTEPFHILTDTPLGKIICGGAGSDTYRQDAFLIIDTGGDDRHENTAGGANGLAGRPLSIVIDLAGNDRYVNGKSVSQGAGVFGIGILADVAGDDVYEAKHLSQAAGFFGCGLLADFAGNDKFVADTFCHGAGMFGAGILWQRAGNTTYNASKLAQGFAGTGGTGLLLDSAGNDSYNAAAKEPCTWIPGHFFSLAQGFGCGTRPFAGGGTGILADLGGDDRYVADVYGQGASYWYSVGLLLDAAGNDSYFAYQYCQGAGIHLSTGALLDRGGNDSYTAQAICQGGAHDYSVGILLDDAGNDSYQAGTTAQGSAINNSVALLFDRAGDDVYLGRDPAQSQAAGHDGGRREYGSIALLLDLAGKDTYSQGQTNNTLWLKPFYGAGLDCEGAGVTPLLSTTGSPFLPRPVAESRPEGRSYRPVDVSHPVERLLRRAIRDLDTDEHRKDAEQAWSELGKLGAKALPHLLSRLDSPNVLVRVKTEELVDALGANAVPALIAGLEAAKDDDVARLCCYFLARFESATNAIPHILPLLKRDKTRPVALYTLGHLRARQVFMPAVASLTDSNELVRLRAAQALGRIGDRRAIPALVAALGDELWTVRYAAEDALVALGRRSVPSLRAAYRDAPPRARPHIVEALAKLGDRRPLPGLRVLSHAGNVHDDDRFSADYPGIMPGRQ